MWPSTATIYYGCMRMERIVLAGFAAHVFLAGVCMMPMASAAAKALPHEAHVDIAMTPMHPMSPSHCENCSRAQRAVPSPMNTTCAGHCVLQGAAPVANANPASQRLYVPSTPRAVAAQFAEHDGAGRQLLAFATPSVVIPLTGTVVLVQ